MPPLRHSAAGGRGLLPVLRTFPRRRHNRRQTTPCDRADDGDSDTSRCRRRILRGRCVRVPRGRVHRLTGNRHLAVAHAGKSCRPTHLGAHHLNTVSDGITSEHVRYHVGDEVTGTFRCATCDLLIVSPAENDGVLVLPDCPLCHSEAWRRVG